MKAWAVVMEKPEHLLLSHLALTPPTAADVVVETAFSGISTGTERLLFQGRMPAFPGMGYPLVPGYESVGRVIEAGANSGVAVGETVFVPGSRGFADVRGLFGGAASRLVAAGSKVVPIAPELGERGVLIALAATAQHARAGVLPGKGDLIVGHGVLGRLLARLSVIAGGEPPTVWETNPARVHGAQGYRVVAPEADERRDYATIFDVSGASDILDTLVARLQPGGEIVLAGFYDTLSFSFPPAFMREARIRVAAEWRQPDLQAVTAMIADGRLSLDGLVTHRASAHAADAAYRTAFGDASCLKMVLDWSQAQ